MDARTSKLVAALLTALAVSVPSRHARAEGSGDGSGEPTTVVIEAEPAPQVGTAENAVSPGVKPPRTIAPGEAPPAIPVTPEPAAPVVAPAAVPADPFARVTLAEPARPIVVSGYALAQVERGAQLTRTGRTVTAVSAGLLLVSAIVGAATGDDCYDGYGDDNCEQFGGAMVGVGLSALGLWSGTITWSSGTLIAANGLRRAGVPVHNGAGIGAVALSALYFPGAWIAAPIQHRQNRDAWSYYVAGEPRRPRVTLMPVGPGGRWGATMGLRF